MNPSHDLLVGFLIGMAAGTALGLTWAWAWRIIKTAHEERMNQVPHKKSAGVWGLANRTGDRLKGLSLGEGLMWWVAIMLTILGVFQVISYTKMQNFISCQANYNAQSAVARDARADATDDESAALWQWIDTLPALVETNGTKPTPAEVQRFRTALGQAIQAHEQRVRTLNRHPYPPNPEDVCGSP